MSWLARRIAAPSVADEGHWQGWSGPLSWVINAFANQFQDTSTASGKRVSPDTALGVTAVWRAVDLLSSLVAFLPLKVHQSLPQGGSEVARQHPNFRLLYAKPNGWMTSFQWRQMSGMSLFQRGNAYSAIGINRDGSINCLVPVHPDRVKVLVADDGYPVYEVQHRDSREKPQRFGHDEMHHLWIHSTNGYEGISPITVAREAIGLTMAAEEYGSRLYRNGAMLSGLLKVPGGANPEVRKNIQDGFVRGNSGVSNMHKLAVLPADVDYQRISMSAVDAQWIEQRKFQVEEICRIFGIPPELLQHTTASSSWGTGVEHRFLAFLATKLDPVLVAWEQAMQNDLFMPEDLDVIYPRFNRGALLRTDILTRYRVYAIARQWGIQNANEIRAKEEMNPIPGVAGSAYLDPQNMYLIKPGDEDFKDPQEDGKSPLEAAVRDWVRDAMKENSNG